jgi:HlyD family secretion protein
MKKLIFLFVLIALLGGGGAWFWQASADPPIDFRMAKIERGDLVTTISATGTIEPLEVVDVGAQVAGLIESFGKDKNGNTINYRSPVAADMVLAHIDDTVYHADVESADAQLGQSQANVMKGQADLAQAQAKLGEAQQIWNRAKQMGPSDAISQNDYDTYQADYETAKANVTVAQAEIAQAQTQVKDSQASLDKANRNLEFCTIRSPVDGVIIDRRVNIGQTVVSSLNAPSLFLIARDLSKMQIWAAINEADVGKIGPGTPVTFTCDAFPGKEFDGTVGIVRLNATMTQNVVMYTVEINIDNSKNILLPYLTANAHFLVKKVPDVLIVPNSALRWFPTSISEVAPDMRSWKASDDSGSKQKRGVLWIQDGQFVRPIEVLLGENNGRQTAVSGENVKDGQEIVVGEMVHSDQSENPNPFLPTFRRH